MEVIEVSSLKSIPTSDSSFLFIDTETTGLNPRKDKILDIQLASYPDKIYVLPPSALSTIEPTTLVGHNIKFDLHMLYHAGHDYTHYPFRDTMLMHHLLNENLPHDLDTIVKERYQDDYKERFWSDFATYEEAPRSRQLDYSGKDLHYTARLFYDLKRDLEKEGIPETLIDHVHKLQRTLLKSEIRGIGIDIPYVMKKGEELKTELLRLLPEMRRMVDAEADLIEVEMWMKELEKRKTEKGKRSVKKPEFSFDSPKQLINLFYDKLKLPEQLNDKTKKPSVDDASLEKIAAKHPLIPILQTYRGINKVYGTYIEGTLELIENGRVHPSYNVNGTATGRISHSRPNVGQMPRDGGIRAMYIPDPGFVFIGADYSSLEVVVEANLTNDPNLAKILLEGLSKHDITATELQVDRNTAKTLNFALQYFCTPWKISKLLNISMPAAEKIYKKYWEVYSGPKKLKESTDAEVLKTGVVTNLIGRKRRFEPGNRPEWSGDYRQAYNFKIQGPGADFTNMASYMVDDRLRYLGIGNFVLSVHDEIIVQVKEEHATLGEQILVSTMEGISDIFNLKYRLKAVSSGAQKCWAD